jgi:hypothetical protein
MTRPLDIDRIRDAAKHIDSVFLDTPLLHRTVLDAELGCELLLKVETLNPIRSFKGRGAELFAATELTRGTRVVCASAGNFGQALAYAASRRGHACTVFTAESASAMKIAAMRRLGAEVRLAGADFEAAKVAAVQHAAAVGARFVEDGAEPAIARVRARLVWSWRGWPSRIQLLSRSATALCWPAWVPRFAMSRRPLGSLPLLRQERRRCSARSPKVALSRPSGPTP